MNFPHRNRIYLHINMGECNNWCETYVHLALVILCNIYKQFINHRCDKTGNKIRFVSLKLHPLNQLNFNKVINKSTEHFRFNYFMILPFIHISSFVLYSVLGLRILNYNFSTFFSLSHLTVVVSFAQPYQEPWFGWHKTYKVFQWHRQKPLVSLPRKTNSNLSETRTNYRKRIQLNI